MKTIEETLDLIENNMAMNELRLHQFQNDQEKYIDEITKCYIKRNIFMQLIEFIKEVKK